MHENYESSPNSLINKINEDMIANTSQVVHITQKAKCV